MKNVVVTYIDKVKKLKGVKRIEYISLGLLILSSLGLSFSIGLSLAVPAMLSAFISFLSIIILIFCWLWGD